MKKIYLTEEQLKAFFAEKIHESIFMERKDAGKFGADKLKNVTDYLARKAASAEDNGESDNILQQARENGINLDSLKGQLDKETYKKNVQSKVEKLLKTKNEEINNWVKSALPLLRNLYGSEGEFKAGKEVLMNRRVGGDLQTKTIQSNFDKLSPSDREHVLMVRDFLDKEGLTMLYRPTNKPSSVKSRYGLNINKMNFNGDTAPWIIPIEGLELDFSNISDSEISGYYDGTRISWINAELAKLGYNIPGQSSEKPTKIDPSHPAWNGEDGKKGLVDIARAGKLKQLTTRYVKKTYGMDFSFGDGRKVFSFGNKKIDDRTVIVNFTAALRCPAWNECLLKDACYARTTEKNYDETFNKNLRVGLIWQQTKDDPTLTELLLELIRSYIFNYDAAIKAMNKAGLKGKYTKESLSELSMSQLQTECPEALDIVAKTKRADTVRLNEDGDFIGQWLVDVWDKWAEDFKLAGVTVAAYTCRALNYEKVKNIILNISQEGLVSGQNAPAVARYFYAAEPEEYDALNETYGGEDFKLNNSETITPVYRSLIDENGELKGYYYKCPCGRGKLTYKEYQPSQKEVASVQPATIGEIECARAGSKKFVYFNGKVYRLTENDKKDDKVDCYKCKICYGRSNEGIRTDSGEMKSGLPIYVLVSAHGSARDNYTKERKIAGKFVKDWISLQNSMGQLSEDVQTVNDSVDSNSPIAIKQITKNAVDSVAEHMRDKTNAISEQKTKFDDFLKRITE